MCATKGASNCFARGQPVNGLVLTAGQGSHSQMRSLLMGSANWLFGLCTAVALTVLRYESNTKSRSFLPLASGFNNCKKHKEEPCESGTLQRIVDQAMHEYSQYTNS